MRCFFLFVFFVRSAANNSKKSKEGALATAVITGGGGGGAAAEQEAEAVVESTEFLDNPLYDPDKMLGAMDHANRVCSAERERVCVCLYGFGEREGEQRAINQRGGEQGWKGKTAAAATANLRSSWRSRS